MKDENPMNISADGEKANDKIQCLGAGIQPNKAIFVLLQMCPASHQSKPLEAAVMLRATCCLRLLGKEPVNGSALCMHINIFKKKSTFIIKSKLQTKFQIKGNKKDYK